MGQVGTTIIIFTELRDPSDAPDHSPLCYCRYYYYYYLLRDTYNYTRSPRTNHEYNNIQRCVYALLGCTEITANGRMKTYGGIIIVMLARIDKTVDTIRPAAGVKIRRTSAGGPVGDGEDYGKREAVGRTRASCNFRRRYDYNFRMHRGCNDGHRGGCNGCVRLEAPGPPRQPTATPPTSNRYSRCLPIPRARSQIGGSQTFFGKCSSIFLLNIFIYQIQNKTGLPPPSNPTKNFGGKI